MGAAYVIMGNNGQGIFPTPDPTGDPTTWTRDELRRWLAAVSRIWLHTTPRLLTITEKFMPSRECHTRGALGKSSGKHAHPERVNTGLEMVSTVVFMVPPRQLHGSQDVSAAIFTLFRTTVTL